MVFLVLVFAIAVFFLISILSKEAIVATVNNHEIKQTELDWWYTLTVKEQFRQNVSQRMFLEDVLIPQTILEIEAKNQQISVTDEEVEKVLGSYLVSQGISTDAFSAQLQKEGFSLSDVRKSFKTRTMVMKLLEKQQAGIQENASEDPNAQTQNYILGLVQNSQVEILLKDQELFARIDGMCEDNTARLFITSTCEGCMQSSDIFKNWAQAKKSNAKIWVLNTGDNLLTEELEKGVPKSELAFFNQYADKKVPALIIGCRYKHIGQVTQGHVDLIGSLV